jgi:hypothetical protein
MAKSEKVLKLDDIRKLVAAGAIAVDPALDAVLNGKTAVKANAIATVSPPTPDGKGGMVPALVRLDLSAFVTDGKSVKAKKLSPRFVYGMIKALENPAARAEIERACKEALES